MNPQNIIFCGFILEPSRLYADSEKYTKEYQRGLVDPRPVFGVCVQQRHRPACASIQYWSQQSIVLYISIYWAKKVLTLGHLYGCLFVWFDSLRPINNLSVKQGLGWTSTKLGQMCLAQGPQRSDAGEARTRAPSVSSQALYHLATALPTKTVVTLGRVQSILLDGCWVRVCIFNNFDMNIFWFKVKKGKDQESIL